MAALGVEFAAFAFGFVLAAGGVFFGPKMRDIRLGRLAGSCGASGIGAVPAVAFCLPSGLLLVCLLSALPVGFFA